MALRTDMVSWWELNETSGTRNDAHSTNHLTDNNTVLYATGKQGDAADFEFANSESLSIADASQTGLDFGSDMSISFWLNLESAPPTDTQYEMFSKGAGGTYQQYNFVYRDVGGTKRFRTNVYPIGDPTTNYSFDWIGTTITASAWHHLVYTFTASTATMELFIDNSSAGSRMTAGATSIVNSNGAFHLGGSGVFGYTDGLMDEVGCWSRVLSGAEITELYNSGSGLSYAGTAGSTSTNTSHRRGHLTLMGVG